ncbi:hypothetical protein BC829DRAFT_382049 [Chytridium lagenaria]|nr:hypothetical protein BC829DRAFT_382049 [Chytridium lagenaria]
MLKNEFQGGPFFEVLTTNPSSTASWKISNKLFVKQTYEKDVKGFCLTCEKTGKISFPKDEKQPAVSSFPALCCFGITLFTLIKGQAISIELCLTDLNHNKRRFFLTTATKTIKQTALHVTLPLSILKRGLWINFCIDLQYLISETYRGQTFRSLDFISLVGTFRLRKIFTLKNRPCSYNELDNNLEVTCFEDLPRVLQFGSGVEFSTQLLSPDRLKWIQIQENNARRPIEDPPSFSRSSSRVLESPLWNMTREAPQAMDRVKRKETKAARSHDMKNPNRKSRLKQPASKLPARSKPITPKVNPAEVVKKLETQESFEESLDDHLSYSKSESQIDDEPDEEFNVEDIISTLDRMIETKDLEAMDDMFEVQSVSSKVRKDTLSRSESIIDSTVKLRDSTASIANSDKNSRFSERKAVMATDEPLVNGVGRESRHSSASTVKSQTLSFSERAFRILEEQARQERMSTAREDLYVTDRPPMSPQHRDETSGVALAAEASVIYENEEKDSIELEFDKETGTYFDPKTGKHYEIEDSESIENSDNLNPLNVNSVDL